MQVIYQIAKQDILTARCVNMALCLNRIFLLYTPSTICRAVLSDRFYLHSIFPEVSASLQHPAIIKGCLTGKEYG
ncbi:hypothetical protein HMPREF3034_02456 [Prevotella sp. DNF00663]|nr:hypothetical protein HMPREF3034_02456 [Prevotella sp. DNF00663]